MPAQNDNDLQFKATRRTFLHKDWSCTKVDQQDQQHQPPKFLWVLIRRIGSGNGSPWVQVMFSKGFHLMLKS
jgi:hypothetical protein